MKKFPKRKMIRIEGFNYSTPGSYFITVCVANKKPILWNNVGADTIRPQELPLSPIGKIVENGILEIEKHYSNIKVDIYCIMPDHIHLIVTVLSCDDGRMVSAPTISTVIGSMKRYVSKQIGKSIWQKSFIDRVIRNEKGYRAAWEYIENNPIKMDTAEDNIDFKTM